MDRNTNSTDKLTWYHFKDNSHILFNQVTSRDVAGFKPKKIRRSLQFTLSSQNDLKSRINKFVSSLFGDEFLK